VFRDNEALDWGGAIFVDDFMHLEVTNCTIAGNTASPDPAPLRLSGGTAAVMNSVIWDNMGQSSAMAVTGEVTAVRYSNIEGGWPGTGNIDADPLFADPDHGDVHLSAGSPCIDAGDNTAVPAGIDTDLDGNPRFLDDPCKADTGGPPDDAPYVDMGAYEFQGCSCDLDGDGNVGVNDFLDLLAAWGPCVDCNNCPADFDSDCTVGVTDFLILLGNWGSCP
jgi:hypothetical protein